MFNSLETFGFGGTTETDGNSYIEKDFKFLTKTDIYSKFQNEEYNKNFKVTGAKIYRTEFNFDYDVYEVVAEIERAEFDKHGIEINFVQDLDGKEYCHVYARMISNIKVVFQVEPVITFNNGPHFQKEFDCDNSTLVANSQKLTVGSGNSADIQIASFLAASLNVKYQRIGVIGEPTESVYDVGVYKVIITLENSQQYDWLSDIKISDNITLEIIPKKLNLTCDALSSISKVYDGKSDVAINTTILNALKFTGSNSFSIDYKDVINSTEDILKLDTSSTGMFAYISIGGKGGQVSQANPSIRYNLYIGNIRLRDIPLNKNFHLNTTELIISNYITIEQKEIELSGISVYNKVFDKTDKAELIDPENIKILKKIAEDDLTLDPTKLNVKFEDYSVGTNKSVVVDASKALIGTAATNYKIKQINIAGLTIYPYSINCVDKGLGSIQLINKRGLKERDKVDLIPLNAVLNVEPIYPDSVEYSKIYANIQDYVKGNKEFAIGYKLILTVNGREIDIDKNLYVSIPNAKNLVGVYYLTGSRAGKVETSSNGNNLVIDLSQIETDVETFFLTQKRILLKPWQIVLIVVTSVMVVAAGVLTFVILRKRKHKEYSIHEKI